MRENSLIRYIDCHESAAIDHTATKAETSLSMAHTYEAHCKAHMTDDSSTMQVERQQDCHCNANEQGIDCGMLRTMMLASSWASCNSPWRI